MKWLIVLGILIVGMGSENASGQHRTAPSQKPRRSSLLTQRGAQPDRTPYQRQQTWYRFVLRQFNSDNIDYGKLVERERQAFIDARLQNPYFLYGLCATIAVLLTGMVCAKLWADHRRAMWITAEMMADIYKQDAYSRQVAQEAIDKYNTHMERCNRAIEAAERGEIGSPIVAEMERLKGELACTASERDTAIRERDLAREELRKKSEILAAMSLRLEALTSRSPTAGGRKPAVDLQGADAKLVTHINNLQERLYAERNSNRRLKGG